MGNSTTKQVFGAIVSGGKGIAAGKSKH